MKLELFDFIDRTLDLIDEKSDTLDRVSKELGKFFTDSFSIKDHFLNVNYRIKSADSLKEKILRDNFYLKYKTPDNLLHNLSDLIGIRIECRFIEDEVKLYRDIIGIFKTKEEDGYYSNPLNSSIRLKLSDHQPQIQKNGFEIYKIDGKYKKGDIEVNFELQIKSLVNVFWGEIDHRVLYKNFNYMLTEDFFRDIMGSIKDSLAMIDRQLMVVFNHLNGMDASDATNKKMQIKALLSKIIHDIYVIKVRKEIGFVVDFKKSTDVIVNYLFMKGGAEESVNYSNNFLRILNRLNEIGNKEMTFNKYIDFEREIFYNDRFTRKMGSNILEIINKDFRWNLFFKIIFEIENGMKADDFEGFLIYIRYIFHKSIMEVLNEKDIEQDHKEEIVHCTLDAIANNFCKEISVDFINETQIHKLNVRVKELFKEIYSYENYLDNKMDIRDKIMEYEF
ncbi:MAG: GTP pyrophosphokinase [Tissierella sp.]|uniref:GTP pyrophosphokinase n=1 Tax=Tissierella sp. TaxID=41274 RepID=UPI003F9528F8